MTLTAPEIAALAALCLLLAGCTHYPARSGVWIVNPTPLVRCEQTAAGVVCRTVQAIRVEDVGI